MPDKQISGYLVVDWKDETHRTRKSKPSATDLGANELLAKLQVNVSVPEVEVPTLAVDIDVPEAQVHAATLDALAEDELPDWSEAALEVVGSHAEVIERLDSAREADELVDRLTTRTLIAIETRPDPEQVRAFVRERVSERIEEAVADA